MDVGDVETVGTRPVAHPDHEGLRSLVDPWLRAGKTVTSVEFVTANDDLVDVAVYVDGEYDTSVYPDDQGFGEFEDWWRNASDSAFESVDPPDAGVRLNELPRTEWSVRLSPA